MTVADYIFQYLNESEDLDSIHCVTGGGAATIQDAMFRNGKFKIFHTFNESNCVYQAMGYAKYSNKIGLVSTSSGICTALTAGAVSSAFLDRVPLLIISGSVNLLQTAYWHNKHKKLQLRYLGIQDLDNVSLLKSITKYSVCLENVDDIDIELKKCISIAKSNPQGPVLLDVPANVAGTKIKNVRHVTDTSPVNEFPTEQCNELKEMICTSERPTLLCGNGINCSNTKESLRLFLEKYQIPAVFTFLAVDILEHDHPLNMGRVGIKGNRAANFILHNADLVICLGTSLPTAVVGYDASKFIPNIKLAVVDICSQEHKKKHIRDIDLEINCDLKDFFAFF